MESRQEMSERRCERCQKKPPKSGERFCKECRKQVLDEMRQAHYLAVVPRRRHVYDGPIDMEYTRGNWDGTTDNIHRAYEDGNE